jgi:RNA polymerase sigma factor (sigma-70 family)
MLLERHSPMVWQVCRALVHGAHDAEDAFQATFLILVRKAASVKIDDTLGPWLYVVAYRTALRTRSAGARQRALERTLAALRQREADRARTERGDRSCAELESDSVVNTEIMRLSDRLRCVVVLCDLEGVSYLEAARRLNLPLGPVVNRRPAGDRVGLSEKCAGRRDTGCSSTQLGRARCRRRARRGGRPCPSDTRGRPG